MKENINKPISLLIEDGKNEIIKAINETNLPATILELIIKDIYIEIQKLKERELIQAQQEYQNQKENNTDIKETSE